MESTLPERGSVEADSGTRIHGYVAGEAVELDDDEHEVALAWEAFLDEHMKREWLFDREVPMQLLDDGELLTAGTADVVARDPALKRIYVYDLKTGRGVLSEAAATLQLAAYSAMAMQLYGYDHAEGWIYQPRTGKRYRAEFSGLSGLIARIRSVVREAETPDAMLVPSAEACQFCRALATCPAAKDSVQGALAVDVRPESEVSSQRLAAALELASLADKWAAEVRAYARRQIEDGAAVPGWCLDEKQGARLVSDPLAAYGAVKELMTQEEFLSLVQVPVTRFETAVSERLVDKGMAKTKKEAKGLFNDRLEGVLTRKPNVRQLVREKGKDEDGTAN